MASRMTIEILRQTDGSFIVRGTRGTQFGDGKKYRDAVELGRVIGKMIEERATTLEPASTIHQPWGETVDG